MKPSSVTSKNATRMIVSLDQWSKIQNAIRCLRLRMGSSSSKDDSVSLPTTENPVKNYFGHTTTTLVTTLPLIKLETQSPWIITGLEYNSMSNSISNPAPLAPETNPLHKHQLDFCILCPFPSISSLRWLSICGTLIPSTGFNMILIMTN